MASKKTDGGRSTVIIQYLTRRGKKGKVVLANGYSWNGHVARIERSGGTILSVTVIPASRRYGKGLASVHGKES